MKIRLLLVILFYLVRLTIFGHDKVRLTNGEWKPYLSKNLPHYGVMSHIVTEAFEKENVEVEYVFFPWKRAYISAVQGQFDGSIGWVKSTERLKDMLCAEDPVVFVKEVLFYIDGNEFKWSDIGDLKGMTVGGTNGYIHIKRFEDAGIKVDIATTDLQNFKKLLEGRVAVFPCELKVGLTLIRENFTKEEQKKFKYHQKSFSESGLFLLISKQVSNNKEILNMFNRGFKKLKETGEYDQMLKDFLNGRYD